MKSNAKIAQNLRAIADAAKRADGTDIPLGEHCREAADRLDALIATEALRAAKTRAEKAEAKLDAVSHALAEAEYRPGDHPVIPVRIADFMAQVRAILSGTDPAPGHTDLMVTPESIDAFIETNLSPAEPAPSPGVGEGDPQWTLKHGNMFPYDAPDAWWDDGGISPPPPKDWAHSAARGVVADLCDRRGTKRGFEEVDDGTRLEIIETLAAMIREAHRADQTGKGEKNGL